MYNDLFAYLCVFVIIRENSPLIFCINCKFFSRETSRLSTVCHKKFNAKLLNVRRCGSLIYRHANGYYIITIVDVKSPPCALMHYIIIILI